MKKRVVSIVLCGLMIFTMTACGGAASSVSTASTEQPASSAEKSDDGSAATTVSTSVTETVTPENTETVGTSDEGHILDETTERFLPVLKDLSKMIYAGAEPVNDGFYSLLGEVMYMEDAQKDQIGFCLYDIDGDGKTEMIIGSGDTIYGIAYYDGTGAYLLLGAGYRSMLTIYENALIVYEGSSGAACYSYDFYTYDGTDLNRNYFIYTDSDIYNVENIAYFYNTTGNWTCADDERITENEFNLYTETGLEKIDFSDKYIPVANYKDYLCGIDTDFTIDKLAIDDGLWLMTGTESIYGYFPAEDNISTLTFNVDGTCDYYTCNLGTGIENKADSVLVEFGEYNLATGQMSLETSNGAYMSISILGFCSDGTLVTQRSWYNESTGNSNVQYEYYTKSMG